MGTSTVDIKRHRDRSFFRAKRPLKSSRFRDYCPNKWQVEGRSGNSTPVRLPWAIGRGVHAWRGRFDGALGPFLPDFINALRHNPINHIKIMWLCHKIWFLWQVLAIMRRF